jgi:glycosyltransferase involved in cell wall biosynthesis
LPPTPPACRKSSALDIGLFDPLDICAIANKMNDTLDDDAFRHSLRQHGLRQASEFSWDKTANHAIAGFEHAIQESLLTTYLSLIPSIARAAGKDESLTDTDLLGIALCIERNENESQSVTFMRDLPPHLTWRIEGPFDSSYSLALVNREMARALVGLGHRVVLHSTEGPGDIPPYEPFLAANPDLAKMYALAEDIGPEIADVTSRNLYPPRVADMHGRLNFLHAYGWEETAFPQEWVKSFNDSLQGMMVMSEHVRKIMVDNGVSIPITVCGIGVDHWQRIVPDTRFKLDARQFRFLHVSSCFPRKGANAMLQAYGQAFRAKDDVSLVIKTFANPHNEIYRWLEEARHSDPEFPDVQILEGDYSDAELKALYLQCHALVAPSRAEGFGLPLAEAMLSSLAVITTGWSGQRDFCTPETAWLVDYRFEYACTHFDLFDSVWAAPDIAHLGQVMRDVYHAPRTEFELRTSLGRNLLLGNFRWSDAARRLVDSARQFARLQPSLELNIGWITTWDTRCGIASYSKYLIETFPRPVKIFAAQDTAITEVEEANVKRCWVAGDHDPLVELKRCIDEAKISTLVIQFNFGFFNIESFSNFLIDQIDAGHIVVVIMHATTDPITQPHKRISLLSPALSRCHRVLVHAPADLNHLKAHGLLTNVALFPHGILDHSPSSKKPCPNDGELLIASYGFFLPHKGLVQLVEAVALLRASKLQIRLLLVNAEYPVHESREAIEQVRHMIDLHRLEKVVELHTEYLSDAESLKLLSNADLIVYPYQNTSESSSAAVRVGIACGRQVAVTPLSIFDDVAPAVHYLPGQSAQDIAKGIGSILQRLHDSDDELIKNQEIAERWRASHRFSKMAPWLSGIIRALSKVAY